MARGTTRCQCVVLIAAPLVSGLARAVCLTLASHPDVAALTGLELPEDETSFAITYVHSVTRTPISEHYHIEGREIVETEIQFEQLGPGLPTEADAGGTFTHRDGRFVVTMNRRFPAIVMQVNTDQAPRLVAGTRSSDLAQWGNRALMLESASGSCAGT